MVDFQQVYGRHQRATDESFGLLDRGISAVAWREVAASLSNGWIRSDWHTAATGDGAAALGARR